MAAVPLPKKNVNDRPPHVNDAPEGQTTERDFCQTWDPGLTERLKQMAAEEGVDDYDPVVAMAKMALDVTMDDRIRFNCHKEVAKYVHLKRQLEPVINIQQNIYELPPAQRRERIEELQLQIADTRKVLEHDG